MRFILAIVAAALSVQLTTGGFTQTSSSTTGLLVAIIIYIVSYYLARWVLGVTPEQLPRRSDIVVTGLLPYFAVWFMFWVLFYTLTLWSQGMLPPSA